MTAINKTVTGPGSRGGGPSGGGSPGCNQLRNLLDNFHDYVTPQDLCNSNDLSSQVSSLIYNYWMLKRKVDSLSLLSVIMTLFPLSYISLPLSLPSLPSLTPSSLSLPPHSLSLPLSPSPPLSISLNPLFLPHSLPSLYLHSLPSLSISPSLSSLSLSLSLCLSLSLSLPSFPPSFPSLSLPFSLFIIVLFQSSTYSRVIH